MAAVRTHPPDRSGRAWKVTKLVPFGAFVRVDEGIEGLVHISELAERHVEIPEQVVQVGTEIFVKVIDIDLERRRISLSLKQANEGSTETVEFDPTLYGMSASYDDKGNYVYPEGFDPETGEWRRWLRVQREEWERQYAEAQVRFEAHKKQMDEAKKADQAAALEVGDTPSTYSSETDAAAEESAGPRRRAPASQDEDEAGGSLAIRPSPRCSSREADRRPGGVSIDDTAEPTLPLARGAR